MSLSEKEEPTSLLWTSSPGTASMCCACANQAFEHLNDLILEQEQEEEIYLLSTQDQMELDEVTAPVPVDEAERIRVLREIHILDSQDEESYDRYVSLIKRYFKIPIAFLSFVDLRRTWFKSSIGLAKGWKEASRNVSFCSYTVLDETPEVFYVGNTLQDEQFKQHPFVINKPFVRFYVGACVRVQGMKVGALCLMDTEPHTDWTAEDKEVLLDVAKIIGNLLEERRQKALHIESEKAKILLSVFYMLKHPISSLNDSYSSLETLYHLWKHGEQQQDEDSSLLSQNSLTSLDDLFSPSMSFVLWQERVDKWCHQCQLFATRLDLILRVIQRLLLGQQPLPSISTPRFTPRHTPQYSTPTTQDSHYNIHPAALAVPSPASSFSSNTSANNQANVWGHAVVSRKAKYHPSSMHELMEQIRSFVPVFHQTHEKHVIRQTLKLEFQTQEATLLQTIYSHPDLIILLCVTLLTFLYQNAFYSVKITMSFESDSSYQWYTEEQLSQLIDFESRTKRKWNISTKQGKGYVANSESTADIKGCYSSGRIQIIITSALAMPSPPPPPGAPSIPVTNTSTTSDESHFAADSLSYEILALKHAVQFVGGKLEQKVTRTELHQEMISYELSIPGMMKDICQSIDQMGDEDFEE